MPIFTPLQLKRALIDAGFIIFRTLPEEVVVAHQMSHVNDPGDSTRMLDTFYEVVFGRAAESLELALDGVRFAFSLNRVAHTDL